MDYKNYQCIGYVISDSNWPCGNIYDISGDDFTGEFNNKSIIYGKDEPDNYKYCQNKQKLEDWLDKHYEDLTWSVYPDGNFYVAGVYRKVK